MEQLCVAVYEPSEERKKALHQALVAYAVAVGTEIVIRWIKPSAQDEELRAAGTDAQAAFVSTEDADRAVEIGRSFCRANPDCALVYCGCAAPDGVPELKEHFIRLFPARPVRYLDLPGEKEYYRAVEDIARENGAKERFVWETKGMQYRIPFGVILYFRSERNRVILRLKNGTEYDFMGKLSGVERSVPAGLFVRVHQSYLVNRAEILAVDKGRKCVLLSTGEEIFISKAHYREALE